MKSHEQIDEGGLRYSSKLVAALNKFTGGLSTEVQNPLLSKYGKAYDHLISGDALRYKENIEAAMAKYKQALELHSDFTEAYSGMGKCLRRKGDNMGAIKYFKLALKGNPFNKEIQVDIAKCYNEAGFLESSIKHYRRAIKLDPNFLEAQFGLALILELSDEIEEAISLYKSIIKLDDEFLPAYNNLGSIYLRQGVFKESEAIFKSLVQRAPDFSRAHLGLALTLDKSFQQKPALDAYYRVLELKQSSRNTDFIKRRIVALNKDLGRTITRKNTTLVLVK